MRAALLCASSAEELFFITKAGKSADFPAFNFHGRGLGRQTAATAPDSSGSGGAAGEGRGRLRAGVRPPLGELPNEMRLRGPRRPTKSSPGSCRRSFGFYSEHGRAALTFSTVLFYLTNLSTARATMPPRMPDTRNSATPCTPTSSTTNMRGFAAPLTDTRFCT